MPKTKARTEIRVGNSTFKLKNLSASHLRPYQKDAYKEILYCFKVLNMRRQFGKMATGGGKTRLVGHFIANKVARRKRILVLAHMKDLVYQFAKSVYKVHGLPYSLEMPGYNSSMTDPFVCSTVQSMQNRLKKFPRDHFDYICIDEGHIAGSEGYGKVMRYFKKARVLAFTATDHRSDGVQLLDIFEKRPDSKSGLSFEVPYPMLVKLGYLVPIVHKLIPLEIDISDVDNLNDEDGMGEAVEKIIDEAAIRAKDIMGNRRNLAFFPRKKSARYFKEVADSIGFPFAYVDSDTTTSQRNYIYKQLAAGDIAGIANVRVLGIGVDIPSADGIIDLSPTNSWAAYVQRVGRITRPCRETGKINGVIFDPLFLSDRHNIFKTPSVAVQCETDVSLLSEEQQERAAACGVGGIQQERIDAIEKAHEESRGKQAAERDAIEFFLENGNLKLAAQSTENDKRNFTMTKAQKEAVINKGIDPLTIKTKDQMKHIEADLPITSGQRRQLNQYRFPTRQIAHLTKAEAQKAIRLIFANNGCPDRVRNMIYNIINKDK